MKAQLDQFDMGNRLRDARESINLTRDELASQVPMSTNFLADVEGGTKGLSMQKFYRLAMLLDVSADYLLGTDHMSRQTRERDILKERINSEMDQCDTRTLQFVARTVRDLTRTIEEEAIMK